MQFLPNLIGSGEQKGEIGGAKRKMKCSAVTHSYGHSIEHRCKWYGKVLLPNGQWVCSVHAKMFMKEKGDSAMTQGQSEATYLTLEMMYPEPLNVRFYLWGHYWGEDALPGYWSRASENCEEVPVTTEAALECCRFIDEQNLARAGNIPSIKRALQGQYAVYHWRCYQLAQKQDFNCVTTQYAVEWARMQPCLNRIIQALEP